MGGFLQKAMSLVPFLIDAVQWVEKCFTSGKGKEKQDAAVQLVLSMLHISQQVTQKRLLSSATVDQCARKVIDAVVALDKAIEEFENNKSG
jgi:hypothetical protein